MVFEMMGCGATVPIGAPDQGQTTVLAKSCEQKLHSMHALKGKK